MDLMKVKLKQQHKNVFKKQAQARGWGGETHVAEGVKRSFSYLFYGLCFTAHVL